MSALPPKADMCVALAHFCFGPITDIRRSLDHLVGAGEQLRRHREWSAWKILIRDGDGVEQIPVERGWKHRHNVSTRAVAKDRSSDGPDASAAPHRMAAAVNVKDGAALQKPPTASSRETQPHCCCENSPKTKPSRHLRPGAGANAKRRKKSGA
jgi:hypothetical protein